jgi:hypothetical protein
MATRRSVVIPHFKELVSFTAKDRAWMFKVTRIRRMQAGRVITK